MPELPEVETVRRQLNDRIAGKTIREVLVFQTGRETPVGAEFVRAVVGRSLLGVERRAKVLVFRFEDGGAMLGHLKMTGKFIFVPVTHRDSPGKHDRILFVFDDETQVVWSDVRKFGYLKLVTSDEAREALAHYGPEPLEATAQELAERLVRKSTRTIKAALLDQTVIAGIGNIYADESLFRANIRPTRKVDKLTNEERLLLATEVKTVLAESLAQNGTSANDYVDADGKKGGFQNLLKVYGRGGEACMVCTAPIIRTVVAQRGTHYCAKCQR
ncbi:MAG: bifunctional DNA-formamidopyrimidine glycosylase/DNA-(apurinic or apyrimidinic site) lyase [Patescibacteria group bacterium]